MRTPGVINDARVSSKFMCQHLACAYTLKLHKSHTHTHTHTHKHKHTHTHTHTHTRTCTRTRTRTCTRTLTRTLTRTCTRTRTGTCTRPRDIHKSNRYLALEIRKQLIHPRANDVNHTQSNGLLLHLQPLAQLRRRLIIEVNEKNKRRHKHMRTHAHTNAHLGEHTCACSIARGCHRERWRRASTTSRGVVNER